MVIEIKDFIKDELLIKEIIKPENRLIMVIGGTDTGKTTLVECIADFLAREKSVGIVDLDMGQSHIGPPTTITWGRIEGGFKSWSNIIPEEFYFTGTLNPVGSLLPTVVGAKLITEKALISCKKVIVDTTGLISGPAGLILKQFKIDLLSPDIVLALEVSQELQHILVPFTHNKSPKIYRLNVYSNILPKDIITRRQYRFEKIRSYFIDTHIIEVLIPAVNLRFTKDIINLDIMDVKNRIVSFRDDTNKDMALGIIEGINLRDKKFLIRTPLSSGTKFCTIVIGKTEVDLVNSLLRDKI